MAQPEAQDPAALGVQLPTASCQRHLVARGHRGSVLGTRRPPSWGQHRHARGCTDYENRDAGTTTPRTYGPRSWGHTDSGPRETWTTSVGTDRPSSWGCTGYRNRDTRTSITGMYGPRSQDTWTTNVGMDGTLSWEWMDHGNTCTTTTTDHSHRGQWGQATKGGRVKGPRGWAGARKGGCFPSSGPGGGARAESGPSWQVSKRGWISHEGSSQDAWGRRGLGGEEAVAHDATQREDGWVEAGNAAATGSPPTLTPQ